jgi:hypothetical protein
LVTTFPVTRCHNPEYSNLHLSQDSRSRIHSQVLPYRKQGCYHTTAALREHFTLSASTLRTGHVIPSTGNLTK